MNILLKSMLVCTVLAVSSTADFLGDEGFDEVQPGYNEDDNTGDLLEVFKRAVRSSSHNRNLCIPWRAPCTLDDTLISKYSFLRCCNQGACRCNLWGNNCRCEATLGR
uniref:EGF-like domain-containing protein n=1 Tax=Arion vulgaris TaxID=1028688 RepID=A0A0B7BGI4_9EUPU